jgi:hypothetical protein
MLCCNVRLYTAVPAVDADTTEERGSERMDIAAVVQRLVTNFGLSELAALPSFQELIGHLAALTHTVLTEVAAAAVNDDDMVQVSIRA